MSFKPGKRNRPDNTINRKVAFTPALWAKWHAARQPDEITSHLASGIREFRSMCELAERRNSVIATEYDRMQSKNVVEQRARNRMLADVEQKLLAVQKSLRE